MTPQRNSFADRVFRFLLRFFPAEFRGDYGREMEDVFREQRRETEERKVGLFRLWGETIAGVFRTAPGEHIEMFRQDGGFALRMMRKNKGFTILVVCILALGIGANTAIFSVIHGVLLRPLPYTDGNRLVKLTQYEHRNGNEKIAYSPEEVFDYGNRSSLLEQVVEYHTMVFDLIGQGEPHRVTTGVVSANYFDVLGVKPVVGRNFVAADEALGAPAVLLFSYEYWQQNYGGDPNIVGRTFRMNDREHTVVGVLPQFPEYPEHNDIYMPTSACPFRSNPKNIANRDYRLIRAVFGKMRPGASLDQTQQEVSAIAGRLAKQYPDSYPAEAQYAIRATSLKEELIKDARPAFVVLIVTAGLVLLIVCANVANLSLARVLKREHEWAIRNAVGASRSRLLRQMVTESTILSLVGGSLGILLAKVGLDVLIPFAARFTPRAIEISLDAHVLTFSFGLTLFTGILFGSIPTMYSQASVSSGLKDGSRPITGGHRARQRLRGALVVAQVAISFALMVGAGLLLLSFYKLTRVDLGYEPRNVLTMLVDLDWSRYKDEKDLRRFQNSLLEKVQANPAVVSAAMAFVFPLDGKDLRRMTTGTFQIEGRRRAPGEAAPVFDFRAVSPGYFRTVGLPLLRGRLFTETDTEKAPYVTILNQSMARHYWGNQDPIGQRISSDGKEWLTIVGIVGDVRQYGLDKPPADEIYVTLAGSPVSSASLLVRTQKDPMRMAHDLAAIVYSIDPNQPVAEIRTLEQARQMALAPPRLMSALVGAFALLALVITAAGIAGVMGLFVSERTREIGIRMALGATRGSVLGMVLRQGMTLIVIGMALGFTLALNGTHLLQGLLFGIEPSDPLTMAGVTVLLLIVAAATCYGPARRATSVDPMMALRSE
jgi:predicted permease